MDGEMSGYTKSLMVGALLLLAVSLPACAGGASQAGSGAAGTAPDAPAGGASGAEMAAAQDEEAPTGSGADFDPMIVKTAELGIRAENVRGSIAQAREVADRFGGDVQSSRVYGGEGPVSADLVFSVPSGEFEAALDALRGLGRQVTTDSVEGRDVTEEFVDLASRERNLLATEESLLELYDRAENVDDTLEVQRELTGVRGRIEELQGRIRYLEDRTATSRISLTIEPVSAAAPRGAWDPALVAARAWDASLRVLRAGATAVISAAVFCWWLTPVLAAGFVLWRRYGGRRLAPPGE